MSATKKAKQASGDGNAGLSTTNAKLKWKDYQRELGKLHVELVKLQEWIVHNGHKVTVVFEGRDGAGKGGVIKAITERVSPRVFHVVALPAPIYPVPPRGRGNRDLRPKLVQPRRRRAGDGLLFRGPGEALSRHDPSCGEGDHRLWYHLAEVLARGERGGADPPLGGPHR